MHIKLNSKKQQIKPLINSTLSFYPNNTQNLSNKSNTLPRKYVKQCVVLHTMVVSHFVKYEGSYCRKSKTVKKTSLIRGILIIHSSSLRHIKTYIHTSNLQMTKAR